MSVDAAMLERIVRQVLEQLQPPTAAAHPTATAPRPSEPSPAAAVLPPAPSSVILTDRVITADLLQSSLGTKKVVQLSPKAIITPAARDWLRAKHVQVTVVSQTSHPTLTLVPKGLILVSSATPAVQASLDAAARSGLAFVRELSGTTQEAVSRAVGAIARSETKSVVLLVAEPRKAACLANRSDAVRATSIGRVREIAEAKSELDPNVWCVNPAGRSSFELLQMYQKVN